jgi:sodium transport system ATP-binding protein
MPPVIEVEALRREWPQPKGPPVVAVEGATFAVAAGEVLGLLGPNGAGKTTIMQMLATLAPPSSGTARVAGHDVVTAAAQVRRNLGYLSTTSGLPSRLTVRECVELFARLHGVPAPIERATTTMRRLRVEPFADRFVEGLSTGMRQRLRIACATVHRPPALILDEPTAGLDLMATDDLLDEVAALGREGTAVLYSTHIMEEAARICDRIAILHEGRLRAVGTVAELCERADATSLADAFRRLVRG